ncbi:hypothetical protein PGTUg99_020776 [Puccinia graminis f. sp. tritici]|uniref:Uncharacterized protein n=1 Tax=Puccinia graminis f. sp. tritici TaxID=56615 RepID=A0A5B0RDI0_PUCGR|nr:hypothetical protein PGTUg99_020776 [Puccinia graminis f. sp. tritici]
MARPVYHRVPGSPPNNDTTARRPLRRPTHGSKSDPPGRRPKGALPALGTHQGPGRAESGVEKFKLAPPYPDSDQLGTPRFLDCATGRTWQIWPDA